MPQAVSTWNSPKIEAPEPRSEEGDVEEGEEDTLTGPLMAFLCTERFPFQKRDADMNDSILWILRCNVKYYKMQREALTHKGGMKWFGRTVSATHVSFASVWL